MTKKARVNREFHEAAWHEPAIFEQTSPGERGILVPCSGETIRAAVGTAETILPADVLRKDAPDLPELSQPQVVRHYMRLSQMCLGADLILDMGEGTCTMKYNPKVAEEAARSPKIADTHPLQDPSTLQGTLEMIKKSEALLCAISGMDAFSFHPAGGTPALYTNACLIRAYHEARGEAGQRDEIITTVFSHPADAATPHVAGFKVITLYPDETGYPSVEALKAALSEHTAGLMMTNPEDTGLYNPHIREFTDLVHKAGGLCAYDQANANGILGIARAREAGFDLCHFNLHKTFAAPHGGFGPACGAVGCTRELEPFLPSPVVAFDGEKYFLDEDRPQSIGKVKGFIGNVQIVLKAYMWIMNLGAEGLKKVAETAVLNNNYLQKLLTRIDGVTLPYDASARRVEQVRYSMQKLYEETGVTIGDLERRMVDYGVTDVYDSHHPWLVPQPFTIEPSETYSRQDLEDYAALFEALFEEARTDPGVFRTAPHRSTIAKGDDSGLTDESRWAFSWRKYKKIRG